MSDHKLSVIIPIYNAQPYLSQCLTSICNQSFDNLEIIALNDGSTDNSLETMKKFAANDKRIKIIDKQNQGYGATCNRGISEATGDWISIIEPDDWILPNMYRDMLAFADEFETQGKALDIIKTPYWRIVNPDTPNQKQLNCSYKGRIKPKQQAFSVAEAPDLLRHHPSIWSAIYRKQFMDDHKIRFKEIPGAGWADNPFLVESLCQAKAIGYLDNAYYCYREETDEHFQGFLRNNPSILFDRWNDMVDALDRLNVRDESIWRVQNRRGFIYYSDVREMFGESRDDLNEQAKKMFARMNSDLVFTDKEIAPSMKQTYASMLDIEMPHINHVAYAANLVSQSIYSLKNLGLAHTIKTGKSYLSKFNRG